MPDLPDLAALRDVCDEMAEYPHESWFSAGQMLSVLALVDTLQARVHALEVLWEHSACEIPCRCAECSAALSVSPAEKEEA